MHEPFIRSYSPSDVAAEPRHSCGGGLFPSTDEAGRGAFPIFFAATAGVNEQRLMPDQDGGPPSPAVDCTLSLGTPSTRHNSCPNYTADYKPPPLPAAAIQRLQQRNSTYPFSFDLLCMNQPIKQPPPRPPAAAVRGASHVLRTAGAGLQVGGGDTVLLPRRCASCDTTSTPLWRNGPRGPKSLCNACGIRYKKEERRAASSAATQSSPSCSSPSSASSPAAHQETTPPSQQQQLLTAGSCGYHHPWGCPASRPAGAAARKSCPPSTVDLSAVSLGDNGVDPMEAAALPYLQWERFNVAVHPPQPAELTAGRRFQDYGCLH